MTEYHCKDHLGNIRLIFADQNGDGYIQALEGEPSYNPGETLPAGYTEILEEKHYYPFGLEMDGPWRIPPSFFGDDHHGYNGKELVGDVGIDWMPYGARFYDPQLGRFTGVDPIADEAPGWTPYRYGFNNPLIYVDPDGLFETRAAAKQYAEDNDIRTGLIGGWLSGNRIRKQEDGTFAITNRQRMGNDAMMMAETFITDMGDDIGIVTGTTITPKDVVGRNDSWFSIEYVNRDGSTTEFDRPSIGPPGGAAAKGGIAVASMGGKIKNPIREILKLPRKLIKKPKKRGQAPTFKKDGKRVEIHHIEQNPAGPFKEMHPTMHRGKGYHGRRHPNRNSRIDHKDYRKARKSYWSRVFDNWGKGG